MVEYEIIRLRKRPKRRGWAKVRVRGTKTFPTQEKAMRYLQAINLIKKPKYKMWIRNVKK